MLIGDKVIDDCFGEGVAVRIVGGSSTDIEFFEDNERIVKTRTRR